MPWLCELDTTASADRQEEHTRAEAPDKPVAEPDRRVAAQDKPVAAPHKRVSAHDNSVPDSSSPFSLSVP